MRIILTRINRANMCVVSIHSLLKLNKQEIIFLFFISSEDNGQLCQTFFYEVKKKEKKKTKNGRTCVPAGMFLIIGVRMLSK